ncbi:hypothetical protein FO519_002485 [Halicephalobus sp. NKZ332]|nr:hypothetical protein FO519_002485 [Halicephalobus sp. NKZ332]
MCGVGGITVSIDFDRPFAGKIYSLDYANIHECIYYNAQEMQNVLFTIPLHRCGTRITRNTREVVDTIENRVYIQMEKYTQTMYDRQYSFLCELVHSKAMMGIDGKSPIEPQEVRRHPGKLSGSLLPTPIQPTTSFNNRLPIQQSLEPNRLFPVQSSQNILPISPVNTVNPHLSSNHLIPVKPSYEESGNKEQSIKSLPSTSFTTKTTDTLRKPITVEDGPSNSVIEETRSTAKNVVPVKSPEEPIRIYATQELNKTGILSDMILEIQKGEGPRAPPIKEAVKIGDILTFVIKSTKPPKDPNQYDIFVHSCGATDGPGTTKVDLIDKSGCPKSSQIVGQMERERDNNTIIYFFKLAAFKFPGPDDVYFSCLVDVSPNYNFPELCNKKPKKYKRELITAKVESYPIFKDIKVNLKDEKKSDFSPLRNPIDENFLCLQYVSTLILGSIIVILTFGCCLSLGAILLLFSKLKKSNKH